jgi:hypothetical protein
MSEETPERRRTDQREVLLTAAADLQAATEALTQSFEGVKIFSGETRRIASEAQKNANRIRAVVAILALVIVGLAATMVRADRANSKANRTQEYQVANCVATNGSRADSKGLWDDVSNLVAGLSNSPANKKFVSQLRVKVAQTFAPRDCTKVAEGKAR